MVKLTRVLLPLTIACKNASIEPPPVIVKSDTVIVNDDSSGIVLRGTTILEPVKKI